MIECLLFMIKRNPSILHVNLSCTGLYEDLLVQFGKALRRSRALQAIHLSGNQITPHLI